MTAASSAIGWPAIGRRADTVDVAPKPLTRQDRARRIMLGVATAIAVVVAFATAQQVAAHGWRAFVFRAPGVGGTPARADSAAHPAAAGAPAAATDAADGSRPLPAYHPHRPADAPAVATLHDAGPRQRWAPAVAAAARSTSRRPGNAVGVPVIHVAATAPPASSSLSASTGGEPPAVVAAPTSSPVPPPARSVGGPAGGGAEAGEP
ncbi:MAG TPA: hypothetical protein VHD58_03290, partial [Mycobacteriales bacterium]|nr:hypothetical protein [Mycobacteriales bacterium]